MTLEPDVRKDGGEGSPVDVVIKLFFSFATDNDTK
jgi:hypothetical protein